MRRNTKHYVYLMKSKRHSRAIKKLYWELHYRVTSTETASNSGLNQIGRSGVQVKEENANSPSSVHVLRETLNLITSRCCFAEGGKEMYQSHVQSDFFLIKPIALRRYRCRRRRRCIILWSLSARDMRKRVGLLAV